MKRLGNKRTASVYWQEVLQLFTKAGAFGIINLFNNCNNTNDHASLKGKAIHHNKISSPQKELIEDNRQEVEI